MTPPEEISLMIRAIYDHQHEAVGVVTEGSESFEHGGDTRAQIEILAAVTAKANCMAARIVRDWSEDEARKKELIDHFAALKENMLNDLLNRLDEEANP